MRPGIAILNRYPLPNVTQAPGQNYNYEVAGADDRQPDAAAGDSPRLPAVVEAARSPASTPASARASSSRPGTIPGFNDVLNPYPFITNYGVTVNYTVEQLDASSRAPTASSATSSRAAHRSAAS